MHTFGFVCHGIGGGAFEAARGVGVAGDVGGVLLDIIAGI